MAVFELVGADGVAYEVDAPDQAAAISAFKKMPASAPARGPSGYQPQHFEFDGSKIPGYNPQTGNVEGDDALSKVRTASGGVLEGIPVVGPLIRGGVDRAAAATMAPFSDLDYGQVLERIQSGTAAEKSMNPGLDTGAKITGAVAGTVVGARAMPGLFGMGQGLGKVAQALAAARGGALIGGADTAVRSGGDIEESVKGAGLGFLTGGVSPTVGRLVGSGISKVANSMMNSRIASQIGIDKTAFGLLARAAADDGLDAASIPRQMQELGPEGMVLDLGTNLKQQAAGLASMPGEGRALVRDAIARRDAGANQRIMSEVNGQLGPAPVPRQVTAQIETNQTALSPEYQAAFRDALPVDTTGIARFLDREISTLRGEAQRGLQRVRTMLDHVPTPEEAAQARAHAAAGGVTLPAQRLATNPVTLLETRKAVDGMLETAQETNARNALTTARQAIDDELRASVPGIKEVDAKYAELARQNTALQRGQTVLSSGREAPRPVELADEFQQGALPQGMQIGPSAVPVRLREGARAEIERIIGTNANDRVALQRLIKGEGDWNRDRLATLFGQDRANSIIRLLDRERSFADTSQLVTRNSETAARQAAQRELSGASGGDFGVVDSFKAGGIGGATRAAGVKGVERIAEALRGIKSEEARTQVAQALTGNSSVLLDALMRAGRGANVPTSQIDRVARALLLTSVGGVGR